MRRPEKVGALVASSNFDYHHDKSLVDDLIGTGYCKYESRLVLRSTEIHPCFYDLFINPPVDLSLLGLHLKQIYTHTQSNRLMGFWGFGVFKYSI